MKQLLRHDWKIDEIEKIYEKSFHDLIFQSMSIHRQFHDPNQVQMCTLLSVKTGACPEDCHYCPQSAHHETKITLDKLIDVEKVVQSAKKAKESGSVRFCMGAAWREVKDGEEFDRVLQMVDEINQLGMETCVTLGMLTIDQAKRLKKAGLKAYNHNLDTSREYYPKIITTRTYDDRLKTLDHVRQAGIEICSGGILGMGESIMDRLKMLHEYSQMNPHPESFPVNVLVKVPGTPLANQESLDPIELVRFMATSRIVMPQSRIRLSAGRTDMSHELQALCFLAGANSIFAGDKLLTTPNPEFNEDLQLIDSLGMKSQVLEETISK